MESAPNRYPATEENTTLTESRNLVISVKFLISEWDIDSDWVMDNFIFFRRVKDTLPVFFPQYNVDNLMLLFQHF